MVTYEEEVIQSNIQSYSYLIFIDLAADLDSKHGDYSLDQVQQTVQSAEHICIWCPEYSRVPYAQLGQLHFNDWGLSIELRTFTKGIFTCATG